MNAYRLVLVFSAAGIAACAAGSGGGKRATPCALTEADSAYLALGRVYRDCAVDHRAELIDRSAHPDFQPTPAAQSCYTAEVEFVVSASGFPEIEHAKVLRTNDPVFAQAAVTAMGRWRYKPADIDGVSVRQIVLEKMKTGVVIVAVPAGQAPRLPARGPVC